MIVLTLAEKLIVRLETQMCTLNNGGLFFQPKGWVEAGDHFFLGYLN